MQETSAAVPIEFFSSLLVPVYSCFETRVFGTRPSWARR